MAATSQLLSLASRSIPTGTTSRIDRLERSDRKRWVAASGPFNDGDPAAEESFRISGVDTQQWALCPASSNSTSMLRSSMTIIRVAGSEEFSVGCIRGPVLSVLYGGGTGRNGRIVRTLQVAIAER